MTVVRRVVDVPVDIADAEALWYLVERWPEWVDGCARVIERAGNWPRAGGRVVWESLPHGRGRVSERVRTYEPSAGQTVEVSDERLAAVQRVSFATAPPGVQISLELDYRLTRRSPGMLVVDVLFIRRAMGDSLTRTLEAFTGLLASGGFAVQDPPGHLR